MARAVSGYDWSQQMPTPNVVPAPSPGVSQQTAGPPGSIGENGSPDTLELWDAANNLIDAVTYEVQPLVLPVPPPIGPYPPFPIEGSGLFGDHGVGSGALGYSSTTGRKVDGLDNRLATTNWQC